MLPDVYTSSGNTSAHWTTPAARADGAVADNARDVTGQFTLVDTNRDRADADMAGHRVTELTSEGRTRAS